MIQNFFKGIYEWLDKTMGIFRDFIVEHHNNPLLWIGLFLGGLAIFTMAYNALTKHQK